MGPEISRGGVSLPLKFRAPTILAGSRRHIRLEVGQVVRPSVAISEFKVQLNVAVGSNHSDGYVSLRRRRPRRRPQVRLVMDGAPIVGCNHVADAKPSLLRNSIPWLHEPLSRLRLGVAAASTARVFPAEG